MRQQRIEGVVDGVIALLGLLVAVLVGGALLRKLKAVSDEGFDDVPMASGIVLCLFVGAIAIGGLRNSALRLANPEYAAAKELLEAVKP